MKILFSLVAILSIKVHFWSSVRINASDLLDKSKVWSTQKLSSRLEVQRFCKKIIWTSGQCTDAVCVYEVWEIPWGVLNSFCVSLLQRLTIIFSLEMRGTDPNIRPLNTHNKMIIGQRWWSCPSPSPKTVICSIYYLCISYIYHFRNEAHGDVCVHVYTMHVYVCEGLSVGEGQLRFEIILLHIISSSPSWYFLFTLDAPHPHVRASLMTVVIACSRARFPLRGPPN